MKEKYLKATLSTVKVDDIYEYTVNATIDGANELITLDKHHVNKVNKIDEHSTLTISYQDLKQLMNIIDKHVK